MDNKSGETMTTLRQLELVKNHRNTYEDSLRSQQLAGLLFDEDSRAYYSNDDIQDLEAKFLNDKKACKNMGQRLELALGTGYLGKIKVVEIGLSEDPAAEGDIDGLKREYHDLVRWMGWEGHELPRSPETRKITAEVSDINPGFIIVSRFRELIDTVHVVDQSIDQEIGLGASVPVSVHISKRMVFAVPAGLYAGLDRKSERDSQDLGDPDAKDELLAQAIDKLIDRSSDSMQPHRRSEMIYPIRTAYYSVATPLL